MNISAVPRKCIELEELPIKDSKVRRLFIIADGQRTIAEIIRQAMVTEPEGLALLEELLKNNYLAIGPAGVEAGRHDPAIFIKIITEELAQFVGPFAAVAMEPYTSLLQDDSDGARQKIIDAALAELESDEDRQNLRRAFAKAGCIY